MKLIIAKPSPYARKARIALIEKAIAFEELMDNPWKTDTQTVDFNPLGKVPVLITDDGESYFDSRVIIEYLETLDCPPALIPADPVARVAAKRVEAVADGICDAVVLTVVEAGRSEALRSLEWVARQRGKAEAGVKVLDQMLPDAKWFVGDSMSIADVAAACVLAYLDLRMPDFAWRDAYPRLVAFSAAMEARPSFQATRPELQEVAAAG